METLDNQEKLNQMNIHHEGFQDTYDTLLMRLDPTPTLIKIKYSLLRKRHDPKTNTYVPIGNLQPKMNEDGVEDLILELDARMSVDKVLSNLKEQKINDIVRQVGEVVLNFIFFNADKYNIDESQWDSILWIVVHNVDIFLRRALDGKTEDNLSKAMLFTDITSRHGGMQQSQYDSDDRSTGFSLFSKRGGRR